MIENPVAAELQRQKEFEDRSMPHIVEGPPLDIHASPEEDSMNSFTHLRGTRTEEADKLLAMDKQEIISYYEEILDQMHGELQKRRERIRHYKQTALSQDFMIARTKRQNNELRLQVDNLKKEFQGRLVIMQQEKDTLLHQYYAKETMVQQYEQAFEDLKRKNYQMENVAFTYYMTLQKLRDVEQSSNQRIQAALELNRKLEQELRTKSEELYHVDQEKQSLLATFNNSQQMEVNMRNEIQRLAQERDNLYQQLAGGKEALNKANMELMRVKGDNDRLRQQASQAGFRVGASPSPPRTFEDYRFSYLDQQLYSPRRVDMTQFQPPIYPTFRPHVQSMIQPQISGDNFNSKNSQRSRSPFDQATSLSPSPSPELRVPQTQEPHYLAMGERNKIAWPSISPKRQDGSGDYREIKKRHETSQLDGVFNWKDEGINLRNVANDFRNCSQRATFLPQTRQISPAGYNAIDSRPSAPANYQTPAKTKNTARPHTARENSADDLNVTLTSLQLEKQRLEGEYQKLPFSLASTRPDVKMKKIQIESSIQSNDEKINDTKLKLRGIRAASP